MGRILRGVLLAARARWSHARVNSTPAGSARMAIANALRLCIELLTIWNTPAGDSLSSQMLRLYLPKAAASPRPPAAPFVMTDEGRARLADIREELRQHRIANPRPAIMFFRDNFILGHAPAAGEHLVPVRWDDDPHALAQSLTRALAEDFEPMDEELPALTTYARAAQSTTAPSCAGEGARHA